MPDILSKEEQKYEDRKDEAFKVIDEEPESREKTHAETLFEQILNETKKDDDIDFSDLKLSVKQKGIFAVLEDYINSLNGVSEQLEAIHNLIKKLRRIAVDCQKVSANA